MLNEIGKKLVEALRSGKYKQGRGSLCVAGAHCCLGVLCEVAIENGLPIEKKPYPSDAAIIVYGGENNYLPLLVRHWAGLTSDSGCFPQGSAFNTLASLNDEGRTFEEIAQTIEAHAEDLGLTEAEV